MNLDKIVHKCEDLNLRHLIEHLQGILSSRGDLYVDNLVIRQNTFIAEIQANNLSIKLEVCNDLRFPY